MKNAIIILIIILAFAGRSNAQASLLHQLKTFNYRPYINHPINDLLTVLPSGYEVSPVYARHLYRNPHATEIWLFYPNDISVAISVKQFTHMNPYSATSTWDINLFRKENIYTIKLYDSEDKCVVGCRQ